jgi:hypothetical protein
MTWITSTAFAGGQAPYFPIAFDGPSIGRGLIWLVVIDPIVMKVAHWIFILVMLPAIGLAVGVGALSERRSRKRDPTGEQR